MIVIQTARQISLEPPQWSGVTDAGSPVYARIEAEGNCASIRVAHGAPSQDVPAATRADVFLSFAATDRSYKGFREKSERLGVRWPETLEGEVPMTPMSEFFALDTVVAQAIETKFEQEGMSAPLVPASARILERAAERALDQWMHEHATRQKDTCVIALCDEDGLPKMDLTVISWNDTIDPVEAAWVKISWR
jgi:hypothetical protein